MPSVWLPPSSSSISQTYVRTHAKLSLVVNRLGEHACSYNQDAPVIDRALGVLLVLEVAAAADFVKMGDYFGANRTTLNWQFLHMALTLALSLHILRLTPQGLGAFALFYGLRVLYQYHQLEILEEGAFNTTDNPFRGLYEAQFIPSPDQGYDCSVYQIEQIGEAEWLYFLPCRHQFHKYCLVKWLETALTCPLCRRTIVGRSPVARTNQPQ
jgi:RING-H2 zinc finger domain